MSDESRGNIIRTQSGCIGLQIKQNIPMDFRRHTGKKKKKKTKNLKCFCFLPPNI